MFREIIGGLLVVLILITGFFSYIILFDVKEIKSPSFTLNKNQYQTEPDFQTSGFEEDFKMPFKNSIQKQEQWIERQQNINQEYSDILGTALYNQELLYIEEYNNDIESKNEELNKDFQNYKEEVNILTDRKIDYYSSMVRYEKQKSFENLQAKYDEELQAVKSQVQKERSNELLNYRLKIETLDLTEAKKQEYREKIEEIKTARKNKINAKMTAIYYTLRVENNKLKNAMEEKIANLTERYEKEKEEFITEKMQELDNIYSMYRQNRYSALDQKIQKFEASINEDKKAILNKRNKLIKIAKKDLKNLKNRYSSSDEERN
ncbi:MAG: hypothetical protein K9K76_11365 [Halanaerobiales bacterium]|nr:hypothetical protein [Halanaerobiales bacterium]